MHSIWSYILVMAIVTYSIRVLPLTLIRREIKNRTIRSFLYYVPYVTLAVMTFPAIINETATPASGAAALLVGIGLAFTREVLAAQGATITAANLPDGGARFTVRFYKSVV